MPYSNETVIRARRVLEERNAENDRLRREQTRQVYRQLPQVEKIDRQMQLTMTQAVLASLSGDGQERFQAAREENRRLERQRQELIAQTFGPDFQEIGPVCDLCGGSGYIGSKMCSCLEELCRQELRIELAALTQNGESFRGFELGYYSDAVDPRLGFSPRQIMAKTLQTCMKYAENFGKDRKNMLFSGSTGLGKTFLSACIASEVASKGYSVRYESAAHLFDKMEKAKFSSDPLAKEELEQVNGCDLLIVADLGTEMPSQFVKSALYLVINDRLLAGKATIISTNLSSDQIAQRYTPQIASRLLGAYQRIAFVGEDIRMKKGC